MNGPAISRLDERLLALLTLARQMSSERDLGTLLDLLAREAARLVDAERATIFLLDRDRNELWSKVAIGSDEILRFDARLGVAGTAVATGQTVKVADAEADRRFHAAIDQHTGFHTRSLLAVPFRDHHGAISGVFETLNKRGDAFDGDDQLIVEALASQAGVAIETVQLLEELARRQDLLLAENSQLWSEVKGRSATQHIVGRSVPIGRIVRLVEQLRSSEVDVLITGESGTGKEMVARAIHYSSPRAKKPLVALNCAALPDTLVESELFGIEKGVATGVESRRGKFEAAHGGTLFLDEIGDLSLPSQAKILRVLQERAVERVGGHRTLPVDVRVLAATNRDLEEEIRAGRFRGDLYYRLKVVRIRLPPLREIPEDIPTLAHHFLTRHASGGAVKRLSEAALELLRAYAWPGNVRQLENEIRCLVATCRRPVIEPEDLSPEVRAARDGPGSARDDAAPSLAGAIEELERRLIREALVRTAGNQVQTARRLGLSRQGLINKLKRYRIAAAAPHPHA